MLLYTDTTNIFPLELLHVIYIKFAFLIIKFIPQYFISYRIYTQSNTAQGERKEKRGNNPPVRQGHRGRCFMGSRLPISLTRIGTINQRYVSGSYTQNPIYVRLFSKEYSSWRFLNRDIRSLGIKELCIFCIPGRYA